MKTPTTDSERSDDALEAAHRLRRIAAHLAAGVMPDPADAALHAAALDAYLAAAADGVTADEALAVDTPRGGSPWWKREALAERDEALREYARESLPNLTPHEQGKALLRDVNRYANAGWRFDQLAPDVPTRIRGTAREHLWRAMRTGLMPNTPAGIAKVLRARKLKSVI